MVLCEMCKWWRYHHGNPVWGDCDKLIGAEDYIVLSNQDGAETSVETHAEFGCKLGKKAEVT